MKKKFPKIKLIQFVSDEAKQLKNLAIEKLQIHRSPDIFHVQFELSKALSSKISKKVKQAELDTFEEEKQLEVLKEEEKSYLLMRENGAPQGRPLCYYSRIKSQEELVLAAKNKHKELEKLSEEFHEAKRDISKLYHPKCLQSGVFSSGKVIEEKIREKFVIIRKIAKMLDLPLSVYKRIEKAERVLVYMKQNLDFNSSIIDKKTKLLSLSGTERYAVTAYFYPSLYLEKLSKMESQYSKSERNEFKKKSEKLREKCFEKCKSLSRKSAEEILKIHSVVEQMVYIFQRSSSSIEGRNGQLSLHVHRRKKQCERSREVQRVLKNFFSKGNDNKTSAERLFKEKPNDLFTFLLDKITDYPSPAKKREFTKLRMAA